jgi:oxygen-dependent protoporphyrinogen oxidase
VVVICNVQELIATCKQACYLATVFCIVSVEDNKSNRYLFRYNTLIHRSPFPPAMVTLTLFNDIIPFPPTQTLLRPYLHSPFSSLNPKSKSIRKIHPNPILRLRCSIAEESTASPTKTTLKSDSGSRNHSPIDCVVVGGGISGLCIAQALSTKHANGVPNVIVTEARDRVGGNIITVERDGFLWEEGPNSFQPSDPMLTMVVCFDYD